MIHMMTLCVIRCHKFRFAYVAAVEEQVFVEDGVAGRMTRLRFDGSLR